MNGHVDAREGECGFCGTWTVLRKDGKIRSHGNMANDRREAGETRDVRCCEASDPVNTRDRQSKPRRIRGHE